MTNDGMTNDGRGAPNEASDSALVIGHSSFSNSACPFLPEVDRVYKATDINALGSDRGPVFYETSLCYAQSQWRMGLPAQAMLQLNRALACCLSHDEPVLKRWPLPYQAMAWIIQQRPEGQFIGNPRRHFQHLATRMVPPHKELRAWRAWACWYLSKVLLPEVEHPADWKQIRHEGMVEPTFRQIHEQLRALSPADDETRWLEALVGLGVITPEATDATIRPIGAEQLHVVHELAHTIWPRVYPGIISEAQIGYMLRQRYDLEVLRADHAQGVRYALIGLGEDVSLGELRSTPDYVGYIAFEPRPSEDEAFLHKLYLLPEAAGRGIGAAALNWVSEQATALGLKRLRLFVNKHNLQAVRAYLRQGFVFEQDVITDIGEGFVMDDFVMVKHLEPVKGGS